MPTYESDICIIGGGITSVMLARKLANLRPGTTITVVEAGRSIFDFEKRPLSRRARSTANTRGASDYIDDQKAEGSSR